MWVILFRLQSLRESQYIICHIRVQFFVLSRSLLQSHICRDLLAKLTICKRADQIPCTYVSGPQSKVQELLVVLQILPRCSWNYVSFFQLHIYVQPNFPYVLETKQHITTDWMHKQIWESGSLELDIKKISKKCHTMPFFSLIFLFLKYRHFFIHLFIVTCNGFVIVINKLIHNFSYF